MDLIAYALRDEYAGTVTQTIDDVDVDVPAYSGGVIRAGAELDINVLEELEAGGGFIILDERDAGAAVHLDEYPPLERVKAPEGAEPSGSFAELPPYANQGVPELRADAQSRGLANVGAARKAELVAALEEHDLRLAEGTLDELGAPPTIADLAAAGGERQADEQPAPAAAAPNVDGLSTAELVAVLDNDREAFADAGLVVVPAALEELRQRAGENDGDALVALEERGLIDNDQAGPAGEEG